MIHNYTDLNNSRWLSGYVCEMIEAIQDDKTTPRSRRDRGVVTVVRSGPDR